MLTKQLIHTAHKLGLPNFLIYNDYKDSKWWVVISPRLLAPTYRKDSTGKVSVPKPVNFRMLELMITDNLGFNEIKEHIPDLTESQYIFTVNKLRKVKN